MVNNDFWGKFQKPSDFQEAPVEETPLQKEEVTQEVEDKKPFQWGSFQSPQTYQGEPDPTADESNWGYIGRNLVANASRLAEASLGKYGDVESLGKTLLNKMPSIGGVFGSAVSEWLGPERWSKLVGVDNQHLPTTSKLKQASEGLSGGYTKAKTPGEELFQEFTQDVGSLFSARTGRVPTPIQVGYTAVANVGKQAVKELELGEDKATYAKLGLITAFSLWDKVNGPIYAASLSNRARQAFDPNLQADVPRFSKRLQDLASNPQMLPSDPRSALARNQINQLQQNIANGQNSIESLMTAYDGVNAAKKSSGMFELVGKGQREFATHQLDKVLNVVKQEIHDVGAGNPQGVKLWDDSRKAWAIVHKSNMATDWINQQIKNSPIAKHLVGPAGLGTLYGVYANPLLTGTVTAGSAAANQVFKIGYRIMNDPVLADYYTKSLIAAMKQDGPAFIRNYEKLNNKLKKDKSISLKKPNIKSNL